MNEYGKYNTRLLENPKTLDKYIRHNYGTDPRTFEAQLAALADVQAGRIPTGETFKQLAQEARLFYGWSEKQTKQALERCVAEPLPAARVASFLKEGGREVTHETISQAMSLAQAYAGAQLQVGMEDALHTRDQARDNDPTRLRVPERPDDAQARREATSLRDTLERVSGHHKPQTFQEKRDAVQRTRLQVADRYEAYMQNPEPSLADDLRASMELHEADRLSKEYGLGSPIADADALFEQSEGHMREEFDPVAENGLRE